MDTSKYKTLYLEECGDHLSGIEAGILALEKDPSSAGTADGLFRHFHSIKGMSASMGYEPIKALSHSLEDLLGAIKKGLSVTEGVISVLLQGADGLKTLIEMVRAGRPLDADVAPFIRRIREAAEGKAPAKKEESRQEPRPDDGRLSLSNVMKVDGRVFDELLAIAGDLTMSLTSLRDRAHGHASIEIKDGIHRIGKALNSLHAAVLSARMLPVSDLVSGLPRLTRDLARASSKDVELTMEGAEITLDRTILEGLGSPLVHIMRNCVDHGIETPDERQREGKPRAGSINIKVRERKGRIVMDITDDGRGLDLDKIRKKAVERGLISAEKAASLSEKNAMMLVCAPGLSTADSVTETSGRGVGMDVVKAAVETLGGTLSIRSTPKRGAAFTLDLPRTASIVKALQVTVGPEEFLIPVSSVEKVIEIDPVEAFGGSTSFNGEEVHLLSLARAVGMDPSDEGPGSTVIIIDGWASGLGWKHIGFKVDGYGSEIDAYVRPLTPPFTGLSGVTGITVMGSGRPVFLLDVSQLSARMLTQ